MHSSIPPYQESMMNPTDPIISEGLMNTDQMSSVLIGQSDGIPTTTPIGGN